VAPILFAAARKITPSPCSSLLLTNSRQWDWLGVMVIVTALLVRFTMQVLR